MLKNNKKLSFVYTGITLAMLSLAPQTSAGGINCKTLPSWSSGSPKVNLHHVFCGELNSKGRAVGYHANPNGNTPSTYISHGGGQPANSAGIYQWNKINLSLGGKTVQKPMSSMFPDKCSQSQIVTSIQYSANKAPKSCSNPSWAKCGPSAPTSGNRAAYCLGDNGSVFTIATALNSSGNVNTGFPIR